MSAELAIKALQELKYFKQNAHLSTSIFLVHSETREPITSYSKSEQGILIGGSQRGISIGFDAQGFFITILSNPPKELFRAMRFKMQSYQEENVIGTKKLFEFVNLETGQSFKSSFDVIVANYFRIVFGTSPSKPYPSLMHIEELPMDASEFDSIIESLMQIFQVAEKIGNPVCWC